jgi:pyrroloquinoline quinone biosynthesis protein B
LRAIVLGAAAGGGFPQWNSNAAACQRARGHDPLAPARTQASLAVQLSDYRWVLLNASPDLRQQVNQTPSLHAHGAVRSTPIAAVILTGGDVDAIAGLLTMRERQTFAVLATARVHDVLNANPIFEVLARDVVDRRTIAPDAPFQIDGGDLRFELFPVPGKVPLYLEQDATPALETNDQTVGVSVTDGRKTLFYIPGCAMMTADLADRLHGADLVLFDGTLWRDDEMIRAGLVPKTGLRMGHMSVSGPQGTMAAFRDLDVRRRVLIHINNSNPILLADSPEREAVEAEGWEVAFDGMELTL